MVTPIDFQNPVKNWDANLTVAGYKLYVHKSVSDFFMFGLFGNFNIEISLKLVLSL